MSERTCKPSLAYPNETRCWTKPSYPSVNDKLWDMRRIVNHFSEDPRFREFAVEIIRSAAVEPRDYKGQVSALLKWFQQAVYYVNERRETFLMPDYLLEHLFGDCDDGVLALGALIQSIKIPVTIEALRWNGQANHVYLRAGFPPRAPSEWLAVEWTLPHFELGDEPREFVAKRLAGGKQTL